MFAGKNPSKRRGSLNLSGCKGMVSTVLSENSREAVLTAEGKILMR